MHAPSLSLRPGRGGFETLFLSDGLAEVELVPARGALLTRYAVRGDEVLFLDEATLVDPTKNVRGGVPLLFPIAGKLPGDAWAGGSMSQHGFARKAAWTVASAVADETMARVECVLRPSDATRSGWPFDFEARWAVSLYDGRLLMEWTLTNPGPEPLPWQFGIHPYFRVPLAQKGRARVQTGATRAFDNRTGKTGPVPPIDFSGEEVDLHLLDHDRAGATLDRGDGSRVELSWTPQFSTLVLWTLPGKDFICVEPWTAPGGALASGLGLRHLAPGATEQLAIEVRMERGP